MRPVLVVLALVACAAAAPATSGLRGHIGYTVSGGARDVAERTDRKYSGLPCVLAATSDRGKVTRVRADASGNYALALAPGHYTLAREACGCTSTVPELPRDVTIAKGTWTELGFLCRLDLK